MMNNMSIYDIPSYVKDNANANRIIIDVAYEIPYTLAWETHLRALILAHYRPEELILVLSGKKPPDINKFWALIDEAREATLMRYGVDLYEEPRG